MRRVVITGGNGCLGLRLAAELLCDCNVVLIDDYEVFHKGVRRQPDVDGATVKGSVEHVQGNISTWDDAWASKFIGADAVVHFAAVNPYPEASWEDSRLSMRMGMNVLQATQAAKVRRFVLASSSHVMGGYLQQGSELSGAASAIGASTAMSRFTHFRLPGFDTDAAGYAAAKLAMEESCRAAAAAKGVSIVTVRIGWCQPGENVPSQMTATATPTISAEVVANDQSPEEEVLAGFDDRRLILAWLHRLWLSTRDFKQLFRKAVEVDLPDAGHLLVNGMSGNAGMRWSRDGWDILGYSPEDNAVEWLKKNGAPDEPASKRHKLEN